MIGSSHFPLKQNVNTLHKERASRYDSASPGSLRTVARQWRNDGEALPRGVAKTQGQSERWKPGRWGIPIPHK